MYKLFINNEEVLNIISFSERLEQESLDSDIINASFNCKGLLEDNSNIDIITLKNYLLKNTVSLIEIKDTETNKVYFSTDKYTSFELIQKYLAEEDNLFKIELITRRY